MNYPFWPSRVYFEKEALSNPRGEKLYNYFSDHGVPVKFTTSHNRVTGIPGKEGTEKFLEAKNTLVVGIRRTLEFQGCRPSADYQLPLLTGCPGRCHYCYLHTSLGKTPYLRVYVNLEEIFEAAQKYIEKGAPGGTVFEGAAVSDPMFAEPFTGAVSEAVKFFSSCSRAGFRLVTKFSAVESLLDLDHKGKTTIRFSVNHPDIIKRYEEGTSSLEKRVEAARQVYQAKYPTGLMIAPIFLEENWKENYRQLFEYLSGEIPESALLTFELITHRFTLRARDNIRRYFPQTGLKMETEDRRFKYGQFGYGKYLYPADTWKEARNYFYRMVETYFPQAKVEYFV